MEPALRFIVYVVAAEGLDRFGGSGAGFLAGRLTIIFRIAAGLRIPGFSVLFAFAAILRHSLGFAARRVIATFIGDGLLFFEQRFPVGDGNLIIVGVDFAKRQKTVPVSAIFDKRSLQ